MEKKSQNKVTLSDIADQLGLSKTSVSRVISGKGRISEETRERVREHINKLGYKPNLIARSLAQSKTMNIAVVLPADSNVAEMPFFQNCILGICKAASEHKYDVILVTQKENDISQIERVVKHNKVDGVILTRSMEKNLDAEYLIQNDVQFVLIGSSREKSIQIDNDHLAACKELTSSVLKRYDADCLKGKIALIGSGMQYMVNKSRYKGFVEGIKAIGLCENDFVFYNTSSKSMIKNAVVELLEKNRKFIFCFDDLICEYVLLELGTRGVKVPEDIFVASYYCSYIIENHYPRIATIKFDAQTLGMTACNTLIDLLSGKEAPRRTLLECSIVNNN